MVNSIKAAPSRKPSNAKATRWREETNGGDEGRESDTARALSKDNPGGRRQVHGRQGSDAAAAAFLSPNYLTHLLRKETGKPFSQWVLDRRMQLARTLLLNTAQMIGAVAQRCGFTDEAYFSRCFRKAHGLAPGQFRRQQQTKSL